MLKSFTGGYDKIHMGLSRNDDFLVKFENQTVLQQAPSKALGPWPWDLGSNQ